ncbi:hypothetical protein E2320_013799, partial [Naja naja]
MLSSRFLEALSSTGKTDKFLPPTVLEKDTWYGKGLGKGMEGGTPGDLPGGDVGEDEPEFVQQVPQLGKRNNENHRE